MLNVIANGLVIAGVCVLIVALLPVRNLITQLPSGQVRRCWYELTILIALLIIGYIIHTVTYWDRYSNWQDFIVPCIFLFGALFVWLTTSLSLQTAFDVRRVTLLEQESITDPLTGIYNRRYLDRRLKEEFGRARRYGMPLSVLLIDIDYFKQINDTHGHQAGDLLLSHLGKLLLKEIRDSDIAARYGGDELLVLALNTTASSSAVLAERLRQYIETHPLALTSDPAQQEDIRISVSIGVADLSKEVTDSEKLVQFADEALYRAKQEGRNRVVIHDADAAEDATA